MTASTKRYKIEQSWGDAWVILAVDHAVLTTELATLINAFWTGADNRIDDADGDVVKAVIKLAASWFLGWVLDTNGDLNTFGMQREFNELEGWPPNGAHGIRLEDWDGRPDLDSLSLELTELEAAPT